MHHALEIQDILSIIFLHCSPPGPKSAYREEAYSPSDLPILARTCRAFKETALDLLWKDLPDLSPLLRCLPEISHQVSPGISVRIPSIRPVLLMNLFSFFSAIPGSSIRLQDRLPKPNGIPFKVIHIASVLYGSPIVNSTRNPSESSRTLLPRRHSSPTSTPSVVNI